MLGAIAGDVIGSVYEGHPVKHKGFHLFTDRSTPTDDSVLTCAVADALVNGTPYVDALHTWWAAYPRAGYGQTFNQWAGKRDRAPYGSWGNGSAMRVSPVAWAFATLEEVRAEATRSAAVTHNHPEGIKGACAVAESIFLARTGSSKPEIQAHVESVFGYQLPPSDTYRRDYQFDVSCAGSVPQAIRAFLESSSFEDAIRNAGSLGGDADTQAAIAGSIAEAWYGEVPPDIATEVLRRLPGRMRGMVDAFRGWDRRASGATQPPK